MICIRFAHFIVDVSLFLLFFAFLSFFFVLAVDEKKYILELFVLTLNIVLIFQWNFIFS